MLLALWLHPAVFERVGVAVRDRPDRSCVKALAHGVSHWIPEEQPDIVARLLLEWIDTHSSA